MKDLLENWFPVFLIPIVFGLIMGVIWLFAYGIYRTNKVACERLGGALYEGLCIDVVTKNLIK